MRKAIVILFIVLGLIIVFGFITFPEKIFRKEINKPVDEKETVNFLDDSRSPVIAMKKGDTKEDGGEVLKKDEMANPPGQEVYKSVDEKGTINFSDNPTSSVITTKKGAAKQDGAEVLIRDEIANRRLMTDSDKNRRLMTDSEIKAALLAMPTWRGSADRSPRGSSTTASRGRS